MTSVPWIHGDLGIALHLADDQGAGLAGAHYEDTPVSLLPFRPAPSPGLAGDAHARPDPGDRDQGHQPVDQQDRAREFVNDAEGDGDAHQHGEQNRRQAGRERNHEHVVQARVPPEAAVHPLRKEHGGLDDERRQQERHEFRPRGDKRQIEAQGKRDEGRSRDECEIGEEHEAVTYVFQTSPSAVKLEPCCVAEPRARSQPATARTPPATVRQSTRRRS
jgi:hypothetical protein